MCLLCSPFLSARTNASVERLGLFSATGKASFGLGNAVVGVVLLVLGVLWIGIPWFRQQKRLSQPSKLAFATNILANAAALVGAEKITEGGVFLP